MKCSCQWQLCLHRCPTGRTTAADRRRGRVVCVCVCAESATLSAAVPGDVHGFFAVFRCHSPQNRVKCRKHPKNHCKLCMRRHSGVQCRVPLCALSVCLPAAAVRHPQPLFTHCSTAVRCHRVPVGTALATVSSVGALCRVCTSPVSPLSSPAPFSLSRSIVSPRRRDGAGQCHATAE